MSVKLIDNEAFYGYRVRRTVNAKLFQEYFSLKKGGKRLNGAVKKKIEAQANKRDDELSLSQVKARQASKAVRCFNANGTVRGISYLIKTEKSGSKTPIFQVGIASEPSGKIVCTSYSINAHGKAQAWKLAVETFAKHKGISKGSKLFKQLLAAQPKRVAKAKAKLKAKAKTTAKAKIKAKAKAKAKTKTKTKTKATAKKKAGVKTNAKIAKAKRVAKKAATQRSAKK